MKVDLILYFTGSHLAFTYRQTVKQKLKCRQTLCGGLKKHDITERGIPSHCHPSPVVRTPENRPRTYNVCGHSFLVVWRTLRTTREGRVVEKVDRPEERPRIHTRTETETPRKWSIRGHRGSGVDVQVQDTKLFQTGLVGSMLIFDVTRLGGYSVRERRNGSSQKKRVSFIVGDYIIQ